MIELYSLNIAVAENAAVPFENSALAKGCTAIQTAPATVQLNKRGVYMVEVNCSVAPTAAGDVSVQLNKNGVLVPGALSIAAGTAGADSVLSFTTLVQVSEDNKPCNCISTPVTIQLINTGEAGTFSVAHMVVTKLC